MEPSSGAYTPEAAETFRFEEEIHSLITGNTLDSTPPPAAGGSSFTALLGLPPSAAVELLHAPVASDPWREKALRVPPLACSPTFPTNATLVDRAARFSVYAAEEGGGSLSPAKPKAEMVDDPICAVPEQRRPGKRKDKERSKGKAKRSKRAEEEATGGGDDKQLPYVHVRARRGQATDSHSLAERARREKINARMKLLQELVPGCSKITGTALVLDEIINHVQSLQRQVEFLSMRLAAVNPRIDFSGLDNFLSASECLRATTMNGRNGMGLDQALLWSEGLAVAASGTRRLQPVWQADEAQQQQGSSVCLQKTGDATVFRYDSTATVSLPNPLKAEL